MVAGWCPPLYDKLSVSQTIRPTTMNYLLNIVLALSCGSALVHGTSGYSGCVSLVKGPLILRVNSCQILDIRQNLTNNSEYRTKLGRLDQQEKNRLVAFYRGAYLKGTVVQSGAKITGVFQSSANLRGRQVSVFVPPANSKPCSTYQGRIIQSYVTEACCDGQINPPCLLKSHLVFKKPIKVFALPKAQVASTSSVGLKMARVVKEGNWYLKRKKYSSAIARYQQAKQKGQLGVRGHYYLGFAYHKVDRCDKAIETLAILRGQSASGSTWQNEQQAIQKGLILLARCYARQQRADEAVEVCNSFLHNPRKYGKQILATLRHPDFGWIRNNPLYQDYRQRAENTIGISRRSATKNTP